MIYTFRFPKKYGCLAVNTNKMHEPQLAKFDLMRKTLESYLLHTRTEYPELNVIAYNCNVEGNDIAIHEIFNRLNDAKESFNQEN